MKNFKEERKIRQDDEKYGKKTMENGKFLWRWKIGTFFCLCGAVTGEIKYLMALCCMHHKVVPNVVTG